MVASPTTPTMSTHTYRRPFRPILLLLAWLPGCGSLALLRGEIEPPAVQLFSSKVTRISPQRVEALLDLDVTNPNDFPLAAQALEYRVTVANQLVASGQWTEGVRLPSAGSARITLPVHLHLDKLLGVAATGLLFGELPYRLDARLTIGSFFLHRRIELSDESVLRLNLPLGLARLGEPRVDARSNPDKDL